VCAIHTASRPQVGLRGAETAGLLQRNSPHCHSLFPCPGDLRYAFFYVIAMHLVGIVGLSLLDLPKGKAAAEAAVSCREPIAAPCLAFHVSPSPRAPARLRLSFAFPHLHPTFARPRPTTAPALRLCPQGVVRATAADGIAHAHAVGEAERRASASAALGEASSLHGIAAPGVGSEEPDTLRLASDITDEVIDTEALTIRGGGSAATPLAGAAPAAATAGSWAAGNVGGARDEWA
jgi:hypothetical protein